jgi:rhamnosyltransferase
MESEFDRIMAIIVTYNPQIDQLEKTINSIRKQVFCCIIVDNSEKKLTLPDFDNVIAIYLGRNCGIAYAQNRGIEKALQIKTKFIILSDQDTVFPDDYVSKNIRAYKGLENYKLAALAPVFFNCTKKTQSPVMLTKFSYTTNFCSRYIKTAHAISSGTFILADCLERIGGMNEKLFIDYVDFEWCWRAVKLGYKIITISDLIIEHQLGDSARKIFNMNVTLRKDFRYFYMIRNAFFLVFYSPVLVFHERVLLFKRVILHALGVFMVKHNFSSIELIISAVFEGITGRMKIYNFN